MNIFFDILLKEPELQNRMAPEDRDFYRAASDFIRERLQPLSDLIEKEEKEGSTKKTLCYTEFIMETSPSLAFRNYSSALRTKMTDCFSEEDGEFLTLLVCQRLTRLLEKK